MRENQERRRRRAGRIVRRLHSLYPDATCALHHKSPLDLLVATVLSAQCTDGQVNRVTPTLFERCPTAAHYATIPTAELEGIIRPTGFFRNKAKSLIGLGKALFDRHGGEVPDRMEDLVQLPGVGRKTANVLLATWHGKPAIPVDTHVIRLAGRLGLTSQTDPVKIEFGLMKLLPEAEWSFTSHALIWHGRRVCRARKPDCPGCGLLKVCPWPRPGRGLPPRNEAC